MHKSILFTVASTFSGVIARPRLIARGNGSASCLTDDNANQVASNFKNLINLTFNTTLAEQALAVDFHDYSDSVNELINVGCTGPNTLGDATFNSRADFINGQSTQSPIPFDILNLWHTCSTVIMRWRSSAPGTVTPEQIVTGIVVIETVQNTNSSVGQPWLMETVYSEFNSGAWLYDLGNFTPSCTSDGTPTTGNEMSSMSNRR